MELFLPNDGDKFTDTFLLSLCIWREARGESVDAKTAVAWSIKNRADSPSWWGTDISSVVLKPYQYSSFNRDDPNAVKFPTKTDTSWIACIQAATSVLDGTSKDLSNGATHYFDKSLDSKPPLWASQFLHVADIGRLHFYDSRRKPE